MYNINERDSAHKLNNDLSENMFGCLQRSLSRQNFQDTIENIWYKHEGKVRLLLFLFSFPCTNFISTELIASTFCVFEILKRADFSFGRIPILIEQLHNDLFLFTLIISRIVEFRIGKDENKLMWLES